MRDQVGPKRKLGQQRVDGVCRAAHHIGADARDQHMVQYGADQHRQRRTWQARISGLDPEAQSQRKGKYQCGKRPPLRQRVEPGRALGHAQGGPQRCQQQQCRDATHQSGDDRIGHELEHPSQSGNTETPLGGPGHRGAQQQQHESHGSRVGAGQDPGVLHQACRQRAKQQRGDRRRAADHAAGGAQRRAQQPAQHAGPQRGTQAMFGPVQPEWRYRKQAVDQLDRQGHQCGRHTPGRVATPAARRGREPGDAVSYPHGPAPAAGRPLRCRRGAGAPVVGRWSGMGETRGKGALEDCGF